MKRHKHLIPYIRRRQSTDRPMTFRDAVRLAVFGAHCYVLVQRGSREVMACGPTRRYIVSHLLSCRLSPNGRTFRAWARRVGRYARGESR